MLTRTSVPETAVHSPTLMKSSQLDLTLLTPNLAVHSPKNRWKMSKPPYAFYLSFFPWIWSSCWGSNSHLSCLQYAHSWRFKWVQDLLQSNLFLDSVVALVAIPFYNFIILPLFNKYIPTMLKRIGLHVHSNTCCAHHCNRFSWDLTSPVNHNNTVCLRPRLDWQQATIHWLYSSWMLIIIPSVMLSLGGLMLKITSLEFTLAQSPAGIKDFFSDFGTLPKALGI